MPAPRQRSKVSPGSDSEVKPTVIEVKSPQSDTTNLKTEDSEDEDEIEERRSLKDLEQVLQFAGFIFI